MSPVKKFFSGNTLEQAVLQAARFFQIEPEMVAYEQVERRHGFLKVRRRVVIGVDPDSPSRSTAAPVAAEPAVEAVQDAESSAPQTTTPTPRPGSEPAPAEQRSAEASSPKPAAARPEESRDAGDVWEELARRDAVEAAEEALRRLFRLGNLDLTAEVETSDAGLEVEVGGPDENQLFEDRGRLLLAIEHLLPRMVRGLTGGSVPCRVDSDNFHEVRAEQLRMLAQDAAAQVRREGRMQTLEPMSPDERRIVHITLTEDPAVETESHGTGLFKRVAVRPVRRSSDGGDRYSR